MPQITPIYLIIAILAMAGVTFATRVMPIVLPQKVLNSPLLMAVNKGLPLAVMTLLILSSLQWVDEFKQFGMSHLLLAQILALGVVLVSYHYWKQLFASMIIGIASLNGFLWLLERM